MHRRGFVRFGTWSLVLLAVVLGVPRDADCVGPPSVLLADEVPQPGALVLILEVGPGEARVISAATAAIAPKVRRVKDLEASPEAVLFSFVDATGRILAAGAFEVDRTLHGDELIDRGTGELVCISVERERVVTSVRLPVPDGAVEARLHEPTSTVLEALARSMAGEDVAEPESLVDLRLDSLPHRPREAGRE